MGIFSWIRNKFKKPSTNSPNPSSSVDMARATDLGAKSVTTNYNPATKQYESKARQPTQAEKDSATIKRSSGGSHNKSKSLSTNSVNLAEATDEGAKLTKQYGNNPKLLQAKRDQAVLQAQEKPTMQQVIPSTWAGRRWEDVKTAYVASPFGASTKLPEEYNIKRTTGYSGFFNTLTFGEAREAIRMEKLKGLQFDYEVKSIKALNAEIEATPEDKKWQTFNEGILKLPKTIAMKKEGDYYTFKSEAMTPSKSTNVWQWEKEDSKFGKFLLGTRIASTKAVEIDTGYYALKGIGVVGAVGRGTSYLTSGGLGTGGKIAGYSLITGGIAIPITSKVIEYKRLNQPSEKSVFWLETSGQAIGVGKVLVDEGYSPIKYKKFETDTGNVRVISAGSKPLAVQDVTGKWNLGMPEKNPFGDTLPQDIFSSPVGARLALKYSPTLKAKPSDLKIITEGYGATKMLRKVNFKGDTELDLSKSRYWKEINSEAQKEIVGFFQAEGKGATGWKGFGNAVLGRNQLQQIYGSGSSVSQGALKRDFGDIDVQFSGEGNIKAVKLWENLAKAQPAKFRLQEGTNLIELKTSKGDWVHIFDIHGTDNPDLLVSGTPLGFRQKNPIKMTLSGQKLPASSIGQEATNKGASVLQFWKDPTGIKISPEAHRMKDVGDWYNLLSALNEQSKTKVNLIPLKTSLTESFGSFDTGTAKIMFSSASLSSSPFATGSVSAFSLSKPSKSFSKSASIKVSSPSFKSSLSPSPAPSSPSVSISRVLPSLSKSPSHSKSPSPSYGYSPSLFKSPSPSPSPSPSYGYSPSLFTPPFSLGADLGNFGLGKISGKMKYSYTPSFKALAYGIKGKAPKAIGGRYTGFEVRPITKGFSWASTFGKALGIKVKKVKGGKKKR